MKPLTLHLFPPLRIGRLRACDRIAGAPSTHSQAHAVGLSGNDPACRPDEAAP